MAVSALIHRFWSSSWNPLRNNLSGLPPHVVVVSKAFAIFLIIKSLFFWSTLRFREPYLPFLAIFDEIGHPVIIQKILQVGLYGSALGILFNRHVKTFSLVAGSSILLSILSAKGSYSNNFLFTSFILLLVGLQMPGQNKSSWIRYQFAVLYIGAALNKLMEPDWQTGLFMDYWMNKLPIPIFQKLAALFPPMVFAKAMCWLTIAAETTLAALALSNRLTSLFIFLGIAFHFALSFFTGRTYGWFFPMLVVSYVAIMPWPTNPIKVLYDGDSPFHEKMKSLMKKFDVDNYFRWTAFQSAENRHGLTTEQLKDKLHVVVDGKILAGFKAFRTMILYNPLSYLFFIVLIASMSPGAALSTPTRILLGSLLLFISPIFIPVGEAAFSFLAKRRYKLASTSV
ncbi:MAG TPA: DCC1-like thiol-disulfide oxidoreductase family protein [Chitinophagaceae bacterium]|nr:DCC1-like thiol-disulfide oxidoreductase family protein [Chitinophagaceae bacterium]